MPLRSVRMALLALSILLITSACSADEADQTTQSEPAVDAADPVEGFVLTTDAFPAEGTIPNKYCDMGVSGGKNVSIPYEWGEAPEDTASFAFVLVDHHPVANEWLHWVVIDISKDTELFAEGASGDGMPEGAFELNNTSGEVGYGGPQPPAGSGDHAYEATIYALSTASLELPEDVTHEQFLGIAEEFTIAKSSYTGYFSR